MWNKYEIESSCCFMQNLTRKKNNVFLIGKLVGWIIYVWCSICKFIIKINENELEGIEFSK